MRRAAFTRLVEQAVLLDETAATLYQAARITYGANGIDNTFAVTWQRRAAAVSAAARSTWGLARSVRHLDIGGEGWGSYPAARRAGGRSPGGEPPGGEPLGGDPPDDIPG